MVFQDDELKKENVRLTTQADGNSVEFYYRQVLDKKKTREAGREIFTQKPYVVIRSPLQDKQIVDREVTKGLLTTWEKQFPLKASMEYMGAWRKFLSLEHAIIEGLPVSEWGAISKTTAHDLTRHGIQTVEALADVRDENVGPSKPVSKELRDLAKQYLKRDPQRKLEADAAEKDRKIQELEQRLKALEGMNEPLVNLPRSASGDGGDGSGGDSGERRPDSDSTAGAGEKVSGGTLAEAPVAHPS